MKKTILSIAAALAVTVTAATAQEAPEFYKQSYPEHALGAAMEWDRQLKGEESPLDAKTRELISLSVAAQIPCQYCSYAHIKAAKNAGASEAEIKQAVAIAARIRHWSTVLYGTQYDFEEFKAEVDQMMAGN
jgi:AhpD family alkylhydroperoxidase